MNVIFEEKSGGPLNLGGEGPLMELGQGPLEGCFGADKRRRKKGEERFQQWAYDKDGRSTTTIAIQ